MSVQVAVLAILFTLSFDACQAQTLPRAPLPELRYPPLARATRTQGDVVVSFRRTREGRTVDVTPVSGHPLLQAAAVESVKSWRFEPGSGSADEQVEKAIFHFRLNPPDDQYADFQPATKVELDGNGGVHVISVLTTGLEQSECPTAAERVLPSLVMNGDFVEVRRWDETVKVGSDGSIVWQQGASSHTGQMTPEKAKSLLERFRTPAVWGLCGRYNQAGLFDGGSSSFKVRIGGIEKSVSEYGDAAPTVFSEVELAVDASANTHRWRHGEPRTESIVEISFEYLPKPGKTKLMDAAHRGDNVAFQAALTAGDKLTDVDASGWTPLMYAASSYSGSIVSAIVKAGVDVHTRSKRGETALMASVVTGLVDEDLLKAGAQVNAVTTSV